MPTATVPAPHAGADVDGVVRRAAAAALAAELPTRSTTNERVHAARSRWLGPALAADLARSAAPKVRAAVAANRHTPAGVLERLTRDKRAVVRETAATNPACPYAAVAALGTVIGVDTYALTHPDCPPGRLVAALDRRRTAEVAWKNANLPGDVIAALVAGTDPAARTALLANPALTHAQAATILDRGPDSERAARAFVWAHHPAADPAWLDTVADPATANPGTLYRVASNRATPGSTLARLYHHGPRYEKNVLANPSCPTSVMHAALDHLERTEEADPWAQEEWGPTIAANPAADAGVLERLGAGHVPGDAVYAFTRAHAVTGAHARMILGLAGTWSGTLADLVATGADIAG